MWIETRIIIDQEEIEEAAGVFSREKEEDIWTDGGEGKGVSGERRWEVPQGEKEREGRRWIFIELALWYMIKKLHSYNEYMSVWTDTIVYLNKEVIKIRQCIYKLIKHTCWLFILTYLKCCLGTWTL